MGLSGALCSLRPPHCSCSTPPPALEPESGGEGREEEEGKGGEEGERLRQRKAWRYNRERHTRDSAQSWKPEPEKASKDHVCTWQSMTGPERPCPAGPASWATALSPSRLWADYLDTPGLDCSAWGGSLGSVRGAGRGRLRGSGPGWRGRRRRSFGTGEP